MSSDFMSNMNRWLEEGQYQLIKNVILDQQNVAQVRGFGMEIILGVCNHLNSEKTVWSPEMEECCEFSLLMVAQLSNPKEVLIALQEQVAEFGSSSKFKILLLPFQAVLLRLSDKRGNLLDMVLETIGEHVSSLPLPELANYCESKDRILLDAEPRVQCISDIYEALAEFYAPFVKQVSLRRPTQAKLDDEISLKERRRVLKKNLLKTMDEPLVCLDLHIDEGESPSLLRRTAEKFIHHLSCVCGDFFSLPETADRFQVPCHTPAGDAKGEKRLSAKSISNVFYLIYGEQFACNSVPCVYSPEFVIHHVLQYADLLLRSHQPLAVHKGLLLIRGILKHVSESSLSIDCLDHPVHLKVFQSLVWLTVSGHTVRDFKILSLAVFRLYLNKLHISARYRLLRTLLPTLEHSGFRGIIIDIIKDQIVLCLDENLPFFVHDRLDGLLSRIWTLPQVVETDLLEQIDTVLSALNLARYLLIRDKADASGFARHLPNLEAQFLQPLGKSLKLSRAHYELELHKSDSGVGGDFAVLMSMPHMSPDQKKSVIRAALNSLDLLESVLARVGECLQSFRSPAS